MRGMRARHLSPLDIDEQYVPTHDGWNLHVRRTLSPTHFDSAQRPLLIVPGYGMNSFIFSYHPRGTSMERTLAEAGFEVWAVNLRGHGKSRRMRTSVGTSSLARYATVDVSTAVNWVLDNTRTTATDLTLIGCSLGGTIAYGYLALCSDPRLAKLVTMGAPLRWLGVHPLIRTAFSFPKLAGAVRLSRTRTIVRGLLPWLLRAPKLLSLYMNTKTIDTELLGEMTRTVEDPHPAVNRSIAHWIQKMDLELDGVNITRAMRHVDLPLLVVLANRDGIVPERTALSVINVWGGRDVEVLRVGDPINWYAHANLFIANDAPSLVFEPMIAWLRREHAVI